MAISWVLVVLSPAAASAARHYEKVSPADKGGGDIVGDGETTVASRWGDAVVFNSRTPFGDTIGSGVSGQTQFIARRTDDGWVTHAITPTARPDAAQTLFVPTRLQIYSDDLRSAVVWAYDLPAVDGDTPLRMNMYIEDTATLELEPVTVSQADVPSSFDFLEGAVWGVSADARHTSFVSATRFLPHAPPDVTKVYQWNDGVLSLASVLPDGSLPSGDANLLPSTYRDVMSDDGTRLVFSAAATPASTQQLYLRIDAVRTAWVSQSELDPSAEPTGVTLKGMTPDGHTVFFTTDTPLVDGDDNAGHDLYRYTDSDNPSADRNLTMISQNGDMDIDTSELVGMSDDGERVYYLTSGSRLWVWDHGTDRLVANDVVPGGNIEDRLAVTSSVPGLGRVTPDGRYVAFSVRSLFDVDPLGNTTNRHYEMYFYSLEDDTLRCVSCPSGSATAEVTVKPGATSGKPVLENLGFRPRFLADDGRVFFSTAEALAPADRNGVMDVYEYDPATEEVSLLSTGEGSDGTWFADASASGGDVFVVTRQRLVESDQDDLVDLYDIREGSTLNPETTLQPTPPCEGETCQPPPSASPSEGLAGSLTFDDAGGVVPGQRLLAVRRSFALRGSAGSLRVRLFAAGRLQWKGKGLVSGSAKRNRAGPYRVRLQLGRRARAQLMASGTYRTAVRLTFVSADRDRVRRTTRVTFRAAVKKGR